MSVLVSSLIDQAKAVSNNRRNLAITDPDWVTFINWAVESWYKFRIGLDPGLYFQSVDFTLPGGASGSAFNLDLAFTVRLATTAPLPFVNAVGVGVGKTLTAAAFGALGIDGTSVVANDLVLIKDQVAGKDNGIYTVTAAGSVGTPFVLTRWTGFDQPGPLEVQVGAIVTPTAGASLANDPCILTTFAGVVDTSPQTWVVNDVYTRFRALHGLDVNPDTSMRRTVSSRNFRQRNDGVGWWFPTTYCDRRKYDLRGTMLYVTPFEQAAGNYRVYYRGAPYKWATPTDSDPLDAVLESEVEAIVLIAACTALGIEETSQDPYIRRINVIKTETSAAYERDDGQAFKIADVEDLGWGFH